MKDLTDKDVLSSWFENPEEFVVQFDPDQVKVRVEENLVIFTYKNGGLVLKHLVG